MINEILKECGVIDRLAGLGLYETLSGVVRTIHKSEQVSENEFSILTFPASCAVDGFSDRNFMALVPDDSKASVAFFEAGTAAFVDDGRKTRMEATARFLAWYNLDRLYAGQSCHLPLDVIHATNLALTGEFEHGSKKGFSLSMHVFRVMADGDAAQVFGAYSFSEEPHLFTAPFAWAAYDVRLSAVYLNSCIAQASNICNCNIV